MASSTGVRMCRREDDRYTERIDMNHNQGGIRRLTSVAVIGIGLALSTAQGVAADSLRPTVDTGGSGAGAATSNGAISAEVSPVQEHREAAAAAESMLVSAGTYYVIIDEQGNAVVPELVHLGQFAQAVASSPQLTCPPCATEA